MNIMNSVDLTLLKATASKKEMLDFVNKANKLKPYSICINGGWNNAIRKKLDKSILICNVIDFPLGANSIRSKINQIESLTNVNEIDYVINIGMALSNDFSHIEKEARAIKEVCKRKGLVSKAIIETCYLNEMQIVKISKIISKSEIDFVKTSTGMGTGGATIEDAKLISMSIIGSLTKIKASGGIKTFKQAELFLKWCDRIGTSGLSNEKGIFGNKQMEEEIIFSMDSGY